MERQLYLIQIQIKFKIMNSRTAEQQNSNLAKLFLLLTSLLLILLTQSQVYGQADRWATVISEDQLTDEEATLIIDFEYSETDPNLRYVRFADVSSLNEEQLYTVRLTVDEFDYSFDVDYVEVRNENDFHIAGTIAGNNASFSYENEIGISGNAVIGDQVIRLDGISDKLSKVYYSSIMDIPDSDQQCGVEDIENSSEVSGTVDMCTAEVDVLYLRTSEVENSFPFVSQYDNRWFYTVNDFETLVRTESDHTNRTLAHSGIGSKRIRPIIHSEPIDEVIEHPTLHGETMERIRTNLVIQQLREQYNADVVVMYVYELPGGIQGRVPIIGGNYSFAYVVEELTSAANAGGIGLLNAHELGHIWNGRHSHVHVLLDSITNEPTDPAKPTTIQGYVAGRTIPFRDRFGTIEHYSNPHVDYDLPSGMTPTGIITTRENAIRISNKFCDVAEFEQSGTFASFIDIDWGPSIPLCHSTIPLCADVVSGNTGGPNSGPYTYEWRYSYFPNASTTFLSSENCFTFSQPNANFTRYYLTLEVTQVGTGQTTSSTRVISFNPCGFYERSTPDNSSTNVSSHGDEEHMYAVTLNNSPRFLASKNKMSQAELVRIDGVSLGVYQLGNSNIVHINEHIPTGLYYIVLNSNDGQVETHPIWHVR